MRQWALLSCSVLLVLLHLCILYTFMSKWMIMIIMINWDRPQAYAHVAIRSTTIFTLSSTTTAAPAVLVSATNDATTSWRRNWNENWQARFTERTNPEHVRPVLSFLQSRYFVRHLATCKSMPAGNYLHPHWGCYTPYWDI